MEDIPLQPASLDLSQLEDDELLRFAKIDLSQVGDAQLARILTNSCIRPAVSTLLLRHRPWVNRLLAREVHRAHLATVEVEDAQQDAFEWGLEAIQRCAVPTRDETSRCQFKSFLYRVVLGRFHNAIKHGFREEKHRDRSVKATSLLEGADSFLPGQDPARTDPARIVEDSEIWACLERAVRDLEEPNQRFCAALLTRGHLKEVALALGISYATAKRRQRSLLTRLRARLGHLCN
jgi:RNA polymerase sigma factor (sigma-70 family)